MEIIIHIVYFEYDSGHVIDVPNALYIVVQTGSQQGWLHTRLLRWPLTLHPTIIELYSIQIRLTFDYFQTALSILDLKSWNLPKRSVINFDHSIIIGNFGSKQTSIRHTTTSWVGTVPHDWNDCQQKNFLRQSQSHKFKTINHLFFGWNFKRNENWRKNLNKARTLGHAIICFRRHTWKIFIIRFKQVSKMYVSQICQRALNWSNTMSKPIKLSLMKFSFLYSLFIA